MDFKTYLDGINNKKKVKFTEGPHKGKIGKVFSILSNDVLITVVLEDGTKVNCPNKLSHGRKSYNFGFEFI